MSTGPRFHRRVLVFTALAVAASGAPAWSVGHAKPSDAAPVAAERAWRVVVTVPPLAWAARSVLGPSARVETLLPPGGSCDAVELTPRQIELLASADIVLLAGGGLDGRVAAALKSRPNASRRVMEFVEADGATEHPGHSHDDGHDHSACEGHSGGDAHAWLDPASMARFCTQLAATVGGPVGCRTGPC
ncbi:MAG: zinc ABC transporter substrate-binding protein, partial [Phycisphaerales bacterium]|nr:zinc ABC transporter substrate-binding protein [Phycisphaerales bacterium]